MAHLGGTERKIRAKKRRDGAKNLHIFTFGIIGFVSSPLDLFQIFTFINTKISILLTIVN